MSLINTTTFLTSAKSALHTKMLKRPKNFLYFFVLIYSSKTTLTLCFAFETHKNKNIYFSMVPPAGWERNDKRGTRGLKWIFISCFFLSCCCCFFFGFYSMYKNIHRKKKLRRLYNNNNHSLTHSLSHSLILFIVHKIFELLRQPFFELGFESAHTHSVIWCVACMCSGGKQKKNYVEYFLFGQFFFYHRSLFTMTRWCDWDRHCWDN